MSSSWLSHGGQRGVNITAVKGYRQDLQTLKVGLGGVLKSSARHYPKAPLQYPCSHVIPAFAGITAEKTKKRTKTPKISKKQALIAKKHVHFPINMVF